MFYLISIQGKYAPHYRFKRQSAQHFKSLIQSIAGGPAVVISSRFRTDLFYHSKCLTPKQALKIWAMHIDEDFSQKQRHLFLFKEGKQEVLDYFFTSLQKLNQLSGWYEEYKQEFRNLYHFDSQNTILKEIAACDKYLVEHSTGVNRKPLLEDGVLASPCYKKYNTKLLLLDLYDRPELNN